MSLFNINEREVRKKCWHYLSPEVAASAEMNNESATETIREAVRVRNIKFNLTWLARDQEIGVGALEAFATAKGNLSDDTLAALTKIIWAGHGMFDPVTDSFEPNPCSRKPRSQ